MFVPIDPLHLQSSPHLVHCLRNPIARRTDDAIAKISARRLSMSAPVPESHKDLFQKPAFGSFTTLMPDGSPQTTPVWVDFDNDKVIVNTALGRQKDKNV